MKAIASRTLLLLALTPASGAAQWAVEAHVAFGYTAVDIDGWSYETRGDDYSHLMVDGYAQVFPGVALGSLQLGAEAGYQHFFWYDVDSCPSCSSGTLVTREVDALRIMGVGRAPVGEAAFLEVAAGAVLFGGWTDLGLTVGLGYALPLSGYTVPVKARIGYVLDTDASLLPFGAGAGIAFGLP